MRMTLTTWDRCPVWNGPDCHSSLLCSGHSAAVGGQRVQASPDLTLQSSCDPPSPFQLLCNIYTSLLQKDAIAKLVTAMEEAYAAEPSTLFVIGSYHIGKERAFFSAAQALGFRIWCDPGKKKVGSRWFFEGLNHCMPRPV